MRHAYLLLAHKNSEQLALLLRMLDHKDNDIYLHLDKKFLDVDLDYLKKQCKYSKVYFTPRVDVRWGEYSLVVAQNLLLKSSINKNYDFYHLISGQDLPLKSQDEIHAFFEKNRKHNFVYIVSEDEAKKYTDSRVKLYTFFVNYKNSIEKFFSKLLTKGQKLIGINRLNPNYNYNYGSEWFSINNELAHYIISQEKDIEKYFSHAICADELYIQTLVCSSKFKESLYLDETAGYRQILRYIDFSRGNGKNPYTFRESDYNDLMNSDYLFARKFDMDVDNLIIEKIYNKIICKD